MTHERRPDADPTESLQLPGHLLPEKIRELLAQGNVRTLTIRSETGEVYVSIPVTAGAIVGGVFVLTAPWLVLLAALAGLLAKVQVDVTYDGPEQDERQQPGNNAP